jgi:hypothetical protein
MWREHGWKFLSLIRLDGEAEWEKQIILLSHNKEIALGYVIASVLENRGIPLRWPRDTLYAQKLALTHRQAAVARSI